MRRLTGVLALLLMVAVSAFASQDKQAKQLYDKGKNAEARQDYISAYNFYHQAYELKPTDLTYRSAYEYVRFLAAASYVHQGQLLEKAGKLQEALTDFEQALAIDPSSFIAQQESNKVRLMIQKTLNPQATPPSTPESELDKRMEQATGPVELAPISQTPITLKLTEDSKTVYETIGRLAGVNVLFDPDYTSRRIRVDLNGVTLQEALEITALESKTFWRPVTPNTIFVAADTAAKRKELEQSVIRTFYLSNLSQPNELQDMVNILRTLLDTQRLQQFPSQQAIVVRGTPDQIAMAGKLIEDLDKSRPEVVVEVAIMQVTRDKLRNLGINPPTSVSIVVQESPGTTTTTTVNGNAGNGGTVTTSTANTGQINLNSLAHLNATNFEVTIPQATANFLMSDSSSKLIQQPEIRASDGQKASLKIGERVPVATGSFQPGIGGVGINPLVNTQFNYIDVGVNIDITPHVHGTDEVTLKLAMDISAVDSYQNIGGIQQPVIGQRKIENEIRMKEGEVNILGGILEDTFTKSLTGIPGLASIPLFRYLFAEESKEVKTNEIVFILIPHIVRAQDIYASNTRAIDVGTANVISLHENPPNNNNGQPNNNGPGAMNNPAQPKPPQAQPQSGMGQPASVQPTSAPTPAASAPMGSPIISFDPPTLDQAVGSTFTVNVNLAGGQNVYSVPLQLTYNPRVLQVLNVSNGPLLAQDGQTVALVNRDDSMAGILQVTASRPPGTSGITGDGSVFTITFQARAPGQATLSINRASLKNAAMQNMPASGSQAIVTVH
ncbi:MAG TPA: cohesin domain-containing protein [Terriglobales bacterium]|nr:cohesin domain-containing protein [Terriglobales bacterium]